MSTRLDPEEQRDVVSAFQAACAEEIKRLDGMVAQYLGDGVLAYFGYPAAHEDDAERAVRAGLAILQTVPALQAAPGVTMQARIGVATGVVVVGDLVRGSVTQENAAIGETTNLAARLQSLAESNTLVIAPQTHSLVGALFEYRDLGFQTLKGFPAPVHVRQVLRASKIENRFEARLAAGATPILGREEELELLLRRWDQAKRGQGRVALLTGEAGIGKSRVTRALQERLASEPHFLIVCHCSPYHQHSALHPVIGYLLRSAGIERDDDAQLRIEKLEALIAQSSERLVDDMPLLAALLSIPGGERYPLPSLTPQVARERTLGMLLTQVKRLAEQQPVLMVFEDLHWIDPTSLELLSRIVERAPAERILLLGTARPEFSAPWPDHGHVLTLALNRLDRAAVQALVRGVAGGKAVPQQVLDQIVARTDGVALFVEELTKAVLESGLLRETADRYELTGPLPPLAIPSTLHASLVARLDRLASVKDIAQIGAVIGREFAYSLLAAVAVLPDGELRRALSQLVDAGLIFQRGAPPDAHYQFKHALVQDAAYGSLVRSRRHQLHARVAESLVAAREHQHQLVAATRGTLRNPVNDQAGMIAFHFQAAHQSERAFPFHREAAERAASWGVHDEALRHFSAGLSHLEENGEISARRLDMLVGKAKALHFLGNRDDGAALLDRFEPIIEQMEDDVRKTHYYLARGQIQSFLGNRASARECYHKALALSLRSADPMLAGETNYLLGIEYYFSGDIRESMSYFSTVAGALREKGDGHLYGMTLNHLSFRFLDCGRLSDCRSMFEDANSMARRLSDQVLEASVAQFRGHYHNEVGEYNIALSVLSAALDKGPSPFDRAALMLFYAMALRHIAPKEDALRALRAALVDAQQYRSVWVQALAMIELAEGLLSHGEIDEVKPIVGEALDLATRIEAKLLVAHLWGLNGRLEMRAGDFRAGEMLLLRSLAVFESAGARLKAAKIKVDLYNLNWIRGEKAAAVQFLKSAHAIFKECDAPIHVAKIEKLAEENSICFV